MESGDRLQPRRRVARPRIAVLAASLLLFGLSAPAPAATLRVPADYPTIQAGIDAAAAGDTVLLANGLYQGEGNRDVDFRGKAITVESEHGPQACIVDIEATDGERHRGFIFHGGEEPASVLRGLTIRGGFIAQGGGIYCSQSSPTIEGNEITGNTGDSAGGGIYCVESSPAIRDNVIQANATGHRAAGGGIFLVDGSGPVISGNEIRENFADYAGGGIYAEQSSPLIEDNRFSDNSGKFGGGGICLTGGSGAISGNVFSGNGSPWEGGGVACWYGATATFRNNLFLGNYGGANGGGLFCRSSAVWIGFCTFNGNQAAGGGAVGGTGATTTVTASIFWGDTGVGDPGSEILFYDSAAPTVTWSDVQGGWPGTGNIDADPLFAAGPDGDHYLSQTAAGQAADSPCVDAANPAGDPQAGATRTDRAPDQGMPDMGFHYPASYAAFCDLDGSGRVDGFDLILFAPAWGTSAGDESYWERADFDGSGTIDGDDLAILAAEFGVSL